MKFNVETIGGLSNRRNDPQRLLVTLKGDDDSSHSIWLKIPAKDVPLLTISQIEDIAIKQAQENFSKC
ncbi:MULTISPECIES: hypothetical protein [Klebsiella]|uniref:hypothetical protein n=1 Tax=Klebsiella TaxID=570 RepID=UPI001648AFC7|nr:MULTISPECIES: hypothetical protein [Klebsiella]HDT5205325.1 hypothetical protein [Klebsiella quasipneumoniae subsp. similipneumoniae]EKZ9668591.1 hypothetical protein [Klebsiella aerogenes]ELA1895390.1 hypothetical protein [Klebsiella aerogenes]MBC4311475.1 hypothetical protein [Klebsiella quasipneumoniae]MCB4374192.1 hypothetical protein [Klebsiella aerogenes]